MPLKNKKANVFYPFSKQKLSTIIVVKEQNRGFGKPHRTISLVSFKKSLIL